MRRRGSAWELHGICFEVCGDPSAPVGPRSPPPPRPPGAARSTSPVGARAPWRGGRVRAPKDWQR
eukprot:542355-Pyramimonas_sp.AAC.1